MRHAVIVMTILFITISGNAGEKNSGPSIKSKTGKHLFILSGQSNMFHMKPDISFTPAVEKAFGKDNVTITKNAERGASIRKWDKDYKWPKDRGIPQGRKRPGKKPKTREDFIATFGTNYDKLMAGVKKKTAGKTYDTVTFVWMQGESDSGKSTDIYFESFNRVVARLKSDLKIKSINIVIGRLSDYGGEKWTKFRDAQVKYAKDTPNCVWVNTDDLNDKIKDGKTKNDLHYTKEGYKILGQRFAEKAISLIKQDKIENMKADE